MLQSGINMTLTEDLERLQEQTESLKQQLLNSLKALPDNPDIKRVSGNCFVMNSGDICKTDGYILSPFYHDFKAQYAFIILQMNKLSVFECISYISKIVNNKQINHKNTTYVFHPSVIEQLSKYI